MTNFTILVANRPRLLKQMLESIGDLSDATVTIRDAGMNQEVKKVVCDWMSDKPVCLYLSSEKVGTGDARNSVIRTSEAIHGRGDYLYISDDDCFFLHPAWLSVLVDAYKAAWNDGFRIIGAVNHPFHHASATLRVSGEYAVNEVLSLASQSMLMSWDVWDQFGPFCHTPAGKVCQSEDVDFCNRVRGAGFKVGVISPALLVNCGITNSFGEKIPGWDLVRGQAPEGVIIE